MRTLSAGLTTHLAGKAHSRAAMLRLDLVDGTTIAVTDHNQTIPFDLGDGSVDYSPSTGILPSDLTLGVGFDGSEIEVTGPIGDTVTRAAIIGGRFDDAVARFFQVNWRNTAQGPVRLLKGYVVLAEVMGGKFKLTIRGEANKFTQQVGLTITPYCRHDFGDAMCGVTPEEITGTVTAAASERQFTVSFTGSYANDYFNRGKVSFDTGDLAGTRPVEIADWTSGGVVKLFMPLAAVPEVGDTCTIKTGCLKIARSSTPGDRTCKFYDNVVNFGGFADVPGSDSVLPYQVPGE